MYRNPEKHEKKKSQGSVLFDMTNDNCEINSCLDSMASLPLMSSFDGQSESGLLEIESLNLEKLFHSDDVTTTSISDIQSDQFMESCNKEQVVAPLHTKNDSPTASSAPSSDREELNDVEVMIVSTEGENVRSITFEDNGGNSNQKCRDDHRMSPGSFNSSMQPSTGATLANGNREKNFIVRNNEGSEGPIRKKLVMNLKIKDSKGTIWFGQVTAVRRIIDINNNSELKIELINEKSKYLDECLICVSHDKESKELIVDINNNKLKLEHNRLELMKGLCQQGLILQFEHNLVCYNCGLPSRNGEQEIPVPDNWPVNVDDDEEDENEDELSDDEDEYFLNGYHNDILFQPPVFYSDIYGPSDDEYEEEVRELGAVEEEEESDETSSLSRSDSSLGISSADLEELFEEIVNDSGNEDIEYVFANPR